MDIKEFTKDFMETVNDTVEMEELDIDEVLLTSILEYVQDSGDIGYPTLCSFKKKGAKIQAYDFNEDSNSLDLFVVVKANTLMGKVNSSEITKAFDSMYHFYKEVIDGKISANDDAEGLLELVELIDTTKKQIGTLRLYVLSNGLVEFSAGTFELDSGLIMEQNVWDIQRVYQQERMHSGKEKIEIDFPANYDTELQCLKMNHNSENVEAYLAIIPGITLAKIYKTYQQALLEKNVRTFLQFKSKVNRGIKNTLTDEPEMFFSYNNGISTTATNIEVKKEEDGLYITRIFNWQIVNGGQTTASIASVYGMKNTDLSKVFVPVKISVIRDEEKAKDIVPRISNYANSQTAVKNSDFSSNDPYLVQLEHFSRQEWVPNGNQKSEEKWYFERTRGQYLDELGQLSGFLEKEFRKNYPKNHRISKTDIAKYEVAWEQHPDQVCKGAEKNYASFVKNVQKNPINVTASYYRHMIAKCILFKRLDKLVRDQQLGGYKSNMVSYLFSALSLKSKKMLDLDYIWTNQKVQPEIEDYVNQLIDFVWQHLTNPSSSSNAQSVNVNEWSKKSECWDTLKLKLDSLGDLPESVIVSSNNAVDDTLNNAQQQKVDKAWAIDEEVWERALLFAKENKLLTPLKRRSLVSICKFKENDRKFSYKQAANAISILEDLEEVGFKA